MAEKTVAELQGQFKLLPDSKNVVAAFALGPVALFFVAATGALCLHLDHGTWSLLRTPLLERGRKPKLKIAR